MKKNSEELHGPEPSSILKMAFQGSVQITDTKKEDFRLLEKSGTLPDRYGSHFFECAAFLKKP